MEGKKYGKGNSQGTEGVRMKNRFLVLLVVAFLVFSSIRVFPVQVAANPNLSDVNSDSVVWSEFSYVPPTLNENSTHYVYQTTWGEYIFPKALPYVCAYRSRYGTDMVSFSSFWLQTSPLLLPLNPVVIAENENYTVSVSVNNLLTKVGTLTQFWDFSRTDKPKISVRLEKTANWNVGDCNIIWVVAGFENFMWIENEGMCVKSVGTLQHLRNDVRATLGASENLEDWREWLIVDWDDEGIAEVWGGQTTIFKTTIAGLLVKFGLNDENVDPSIVGSSTNQNAVSYPFQRKTFYAAGRYWAFYSSGVNMAYRTSTDGVNWSSAYAIGSASFGYYFSVKFDGTYIHYARKYSNYLYYRRGIPQTDNTISWSASEQAAIDFSQVNYYLFNTNISDNLWATSSTSGTENLDTTVTVGTNGIDNYFYITPFTAKDNVPDNTALPSQILLKGWRTPQITIPYYRPLTVAVKLQNIDATAYAGNLYYRFWKSSNADMSNAVLAKDWQYLSFSFTATAGENQSISGSSFYLDNYPDNEYLYVEFVWKITTAQSENVNAGFRFNACSYSEFYLYSGTTDYPAIDVTENEVFIGFTAFSYPFVTKATVTDGTWTTSSGFPYRLTTTTGTWYVVPVALTSGKAYVIYARGTVPGYGKLWDGSSWGSEETAISDIESGFAYSAVAQGDNVFVVFNHDTQANGIRFNKRTYGVGWGTENSIQTNTLQYTSPSLTIDPATGDLYCFWYDTPTENRVYHKKYTASTNTWDTSPTEFYNETEGFFGTYGYLFSTSEKVQNNKVAILWCSKTSSPYNVKFDTLTVSVGEQLEKILPQGLSVASEVFKTSGFARTVSQVFEALDVVSRLFELGRRTEQSLPLFGEVSAVKGIVEALSASTSYSLQGILLVLKEKGQSIFGMLRLVDAIRKSAGFGRGISVTFSIPASLSRLLGMVRSILGGYDLAGEVKTTSPYAVKVSIYPSRQTGPKGITVWFTVTVVNVGSKEDSYLLSASSSAGWSVRLGENSVSLAPAESRDVPLMVVLGQGQDVVTVTATSEGDPNVSDTATAVAASYSPSKVVPLQDQDSLMAAAILAAGLGAAGFAFALKRRKGREEEEGL